MKKLLLLLLLIPSLAFSQARVRIVGTGALLASDTTLLVDTSIVQTLKSIYSLPLILKITSQNDRGYFEIVSATSLLGNVGAFTKFKITRGLGESNPKNFAENDNVDLYTSPLILNGTQIPASKFFTKDSTLPASQITGVLPVANGGTMTGKTAMSATINTITVPMTSAIYTVTPTGAMTLNATAGTYQGQQVLFIIMTSGTSSFNLTPGTNFKSAVLATGTTSAKVFKWNFEWDGSLWQEISRTAAQ